MHLASRAFAFYKVHDIFYWIQAASLEDKFMQAGTDFATMDSGESIEWNVCFNLVQIQTF